MVVEVILYVLVILSVAYCGYAWGTISDRLIDRMENPGRMENLGREDYDVPHFHINRHEDRNADR